VNVEVGAGAQRMVGTLKGHLVGVEAELGARAPATPTEKLRVKVEIPAPRTALCPGSRSRDRPRLSGRKTRWRPTRCVPIYSTFVVPGVLIGGARYHMSQNTELSREELFRRESELKEKALRNKVVRTRKRTSSNAESSGARGST
jgi:hypothetical protein